MTFLLLTSNFWYSSIKTVSELYQYIFQDILLMRIPIPTKQPQQVQARYQQCISVVHRYRPDRRLFRHQYDPHKLVHLEYNCHHMNAHCYKYHQDKLLHRQTELALKIFLLENFDIFCKNKLLLYYNNGLRTVT